MKEVRHAILGREGKDAQLVKSGVHSDKEHSLGQRKR